MYDRPLFLPAGDQSIVVELGDTIDPQTNRSIRNLTLAIENSAIDGVTELVPTYRSILVYYNPLVIGYDQVQEQIKQISRNIDDQAIGSPRVVQIPTLYGGEYGPDIEFVAEHAGLTTDEVIKVHSGADYLVYMMGFSPGFPYLGGLDEKLITPRLQTPRTEIPAGSVGIAESQTGAYPTASPGGWQLIGRTPVKMFDPGREPPALLSVGDYVRFVPLDTEEEFLKIRQQADRGEYQVVTEAA